jgi:hypothetical protein
VDSTPRSNVGGGAWATTHVGVIWLVAYVVQDGCNVCAMWDCGMIHLKRIYNF